ELMPAFDQTGTGLLDCLDNPDAQTTRREPWPSLERVVAAVLLLLLSPPLLLLALILFGLSRRAPFIAHRRVGQHGREIWVWKLRTLWDGAPTGRSRLVEYIADDEGPGLKGPEDQRVGHGFAAFCRRHSLDEFPQLVNVVRGEMSLVGPRPVTR